MSCALPPKPIRPIFSAGPDNVLCPPAPQPHHDTMRIFRMEETTIDRAVMGRLAKALAFICSAGHPATVALQTAFDSGSAGDIKKGPHVVPQAEAGRAARGVEHAQRLKLGDGCLPPPFSRGFAVSGGQSNRIRAGQPASAAAFNRSTNARRLSSARLLMHQRSLPAAASERRACS